MQPDDVRANASSPDISLLSQLGLVAAVAALVGASCCALPLALAWFGLAGAWIANLGIFVAYRPYITAGAVVLIGMGWVIASRRRAAKRTFIVLALATILVGVEVWVSSMRPSSRGIWLHCGGSDDDWIVHGKTSAQVATSLHHHLPTLRPPSDRDDADRCMRWFLSLQGMWSDAETQARRLLRVLHLWDDTLPPDPAGTRRRRWNGVLWGAA